MLCRAGRLLFFHRWAYVFKSLFKGNFKTWISLGAVLNAQRSIWRKDGFMGRTKKGGAVISLVIRPDDVRVRKPYAPPVRPMQDLRRKGPKRRPDHMADAVE